uniref:Predicted protein n=1 Tax=Hordeum vulgare subsp. vulgare TaxID=112509 RepID=F2EFK3_HORVV|nr:predicted protein [Hordeum vulgare subsp. vulgare]
MPTFKAFLTLVLAVLTPMAAASQDTVTNLTLHNLCAYPVWPLITPNIGHPAIPDPDDAASRLDGGGEGLATLAFPSGAWSGRVVARTGCSSSDDYDSSSSPAAVTRCDTGVPPAPATVTQVSVHGPGGLAAYSVSLVDGFNLPVMVTPHRFEQGQHQQCPSLGCAVDLDVDCPRDARAPADGCRAQGQGHFFKERCPDTRTTPTDVEATPQRCIQPGELKILFCPDSSN